MEDKTIKKQIAGMWNERYSDYDDCYAHGLKSERETMEWLKLMDGLIDKKEAHVLDVGAGTGFLSLFMANLGHHCKGLDLSGNMLSVAKEKAKRAGYTNVTFEIGDAENTGEESNSYDFVTNRHLMWTLPHPKKALREWKRVLKPGGKLIIIEGNWFYEGPFDKLQVFLGTCLLSLQEGRNAFAKHGGYVAELQDSLPMTKSKNARRLKDMVKEAGFTHVLVFEPEAVDKAEKAAMPLARRLLNPHKRLVIIGVKE